jgi:hypothetical protein
MESCHEPDLQAPDAVPNAVPQALPLLRNGPEGSTRAPWPKRSSSIWKGMSIRQKGAIADAMKGQYRWSGSAYARASAALKCAILQCMIRRYCIT